MKVLDAVLVITGLAVLVSVVCLAQTQSEEEPQLSWVQIFVNILSRLCGEGGEECLAKGFQCMDQNVQEVKFDTDEDVNRLKPNITACAAQVGVTDADFSELNVASIKAAMDPATGEFKVVEFMAQFGVQAHHLEPMVECFLDMRGDIATLKACLSAGA